MAYNYQHCLRWNEFDGNAKIYWKKLQMENSFCDVTLACEDKQIMTHKIILSSCSPVLRNILTLCPTGHPMIYLTKVKYTNLQNLLNFMYQGEADVAEEDLSSFIEIAEDLNIRGLCDRNTEGYESNKEDLLNFTYPGEPSVAEEDIPSFLENTEDLNSRGPGNINSEGYESNKENILQVNNLNIDLSPKRKRFKYKKQENVTDNNVHHFPLDDIDKKKSIVPKEITNKEFDQVYISNHEKNVVSTVVIQNPRKSYQCSECNYKANYTSHLKQHKESVHEGVRHSCDQCGYKTTTPSHLREHIQIKHVGIRYPCDQCDYKATRSRTLRNHKLNYHY